MVYDRGPLFQICIGPWQKNQDGRGSRQQVNTALIEATVIFPGPLEYLVYDRGPSFQISPNNQDLRASPTRGEYSIDCSMNSYIPDKRFELGVDT